MKKANCFLVALLFIVSNVFGQTTIFEDDFESGEFKPSWSTHPNLSGANGIVEVVPEYPNNGQYAAKMGKSADAGGFTTNALDLHLNLQGQTQVELTFWIYDFSDETQVQDGIYFSDNNGASFTKVLDFKPQDWCDYQYGQFPPIEIHKLAAQNGLALTSQFVIRFQQHDDGDFGGSPDGWFLDDVRVYVPALEYFPVTPLQPFEENFETGNLRPMWAWRFADATNTLAAIPTRPSNYTEVQTQYTHTGQYSVAMGKTCDDGFATNALDLHLNLQGQSKAELTFWILDYSDETQADDGIYFSDNGGASFKKVFNFQPLDWCDYQYGEFPPIEIHKLAAQYGLALTSQFVIRFQQHDDGDFGGSPDGWFLDDVRVYVPALEYFPVTITQPFEEDFETGNLRPMWAWRFADATNTLATIPTRPSNYTEVQTQYTHTGQYSVAMGKTCDDGFATNALDLHLNLQGQPKAELTFWILDYSDETQANDGIYFSDNGGATFKKMFGFQPSDWCDYQYGQFPPIEIHKLAAQYGLALTSQFVIRFQQHDDGDFGGSPDGWFLDDVRVYVPALEYASVPFQEDFETGNLRPMWAWRFADATALPATDVTRPSNYVFVDPNYAHTGQYSATFGKRCDDGLATNALDLHLNLAGASGVKLSFWINVWAEETHIQDGIWFSNNGGQSFTKVYSFDFDNNIDYQYYQLELDVNALAATNNLPLTNQFIIRFQQHDDSDFGGSPDGYFLDDINVMGIVSSKEQIAQQTVTIFPNPAQHHLTILRADASSHSATYQLLDAQGQLLKTGTLTGNNEQIDLAGIPAGILFLEVREAQQVWRQKVVKQH